MKIKGTETVVKEVSVNVNPNEVVEKLFDEWELKIGAYHDAYILSGDRCKNVKAGWSNPDKILDTSVFDPNKKYWVTDVDEGGSHSWIVTRLCRLDPVTEDEEQIYNAFCNIRKLTHSDFFKE